MGTQQSSRAAGLHSPSSGSGSLRSLGLEDAASPFASPPRVWHHNEKSSPQKGSSASSQSQSQSPQKGRWHRSSGESSNPATASTSAPRTASPDLEAGNAELEKESTDIFAIDDARAQSYFGASSQNSAALAECSQRARPKARGSSNARPKWTRPRPSSAAGSRSQSCGPRHVSNDSLGVNADNIADPHPFEVDERGLSLTQEERLAKLSVREAEDLAIMRKNAQDYEPPRTPSTISGADSGFNCTQSSRWSSSDWSSRPTSASSSKAGGRVEDYHEVLVDCSRDSKARASLKTAWG